MSVIYLCRYEEGLGLPPSRADDSIRNRTASNANSVVLFLPIMMQEEMDRCADSNEAMVV